MSAQTAITLVLLVIGTPAALFALGYGVRRPWWKSWEGRALESSAIAWTLVCLGFLIDARAGISDWWFVLIGAVAAVGTWLKFGLFLHSELTDE